MREDRRRDLWALAPGLGLAAAYVLVLLALDHLIYFADTCEIFDLAGGLVFAGHWPLVDTNIFGNFFLGPLTDYLTALPLAITGHLRPAYYFLWLLYLSSIPLFYFAVRRHLETPVAAGWATFWFSWQVVFGELMITPWNTSYLPLFLAAFTYFLLNKSEGPWLLVLYFIIGLCTHLHITSVLLIVAAVIYLATTRRRLVRDLPWHALGVAIVVGLNASAIWYHFHQQWAATAVTAHQVKRMALSFDWSTFVSFLVAGPLLFALPFIVFWWLAPRSSDEKTWFDESSHRRLLLAFVVVDVLVALIEGVAHKGRFRYYYFFSPFFCLAIGLAANHFYRVAHRRRKRWAAALLALIAIAPLASVVRTEVDRSYQHLTRNERLADALHDWLRASGRVGTTRFVQQMYAVQGDQVYLGEINDKCVETMLRVRYPRDYRWRDEGQLIRIYSFHQVNEPPTYQVEHYRRQHFDRLQTCPRRIVLEGDEHYVCPSREDQFP